MVAATARAPFFRALFCWRGAAVAHASQRASELGIPAQVKSHVSRTGSKDAPQPAGRDACATGLQFPFPTEQTPAKIV
jgi:hypothetical protein